MTIERDDAALEAALAAARGRTIPPDDLVARVLADAARVQAEQMAAAPAPRRAGWVQGLVAGMGGWRAVSGVSLAGVAGLAMGFAAPDLVDAWSGGQIWALSGGAGTMPEIGALWDGAWEEFGDV
ncbi:hypothetical protein [Roseicyclus mahoneyensis]|uniref:Dihydroorotate dehydrogenase n=1 Tax=Roseicyclus mahoneyensis TaxID=164332 RepID=A0A316GHY6_9RHOB|nr:hypothetical protein [Roseicyclus mahoneyensis]PWK60676.1 hypothetical protein C7455_104314 [Roseicyclus mahoneyensis]